MSNQKPKRHHYIPQFILRNFNDEKSQVNYWNIETKTLEKRNTKSVFMNLHMYRDDSNHPDDPTYIESSLSIFESEISDLIKKFVLESRIEITRAELEKLRIFLSLLSFRSDLRMNQYKNNNFDNVTRSTLQNYSNDSFEDLWKREIEEIAKCRTYKQIEESKIIDPIIKQDLMNDLTSFYMTVIEARGEDFLISDVYPTLEIFPLEEKVSIHMHCFFPISSTRMLVLNHIMFKNDIPNDPIISPMKSFSQIHGNALIPPKNKYVVNGFHNPNDKYIYNVQKIYSHDIEYINALFLNEAHIGFVFKNPCKIKSSVKAFNKRAYTKQKHEKLEEFLSH